MLQFQIAFYDDKESTKFLGNVFQVSSVQLSWGGIIQNDLSKSHSIHSLSKGKKYYDFPVR